MDLSNIEVNKQSSIRIAGSKVLYFDALEIPNESHDADFIFITHEHFDHFDPVSIAKIMKDSSVIVAPESMKKKVLSELSTDESKCVFCQPNEDYELKQINVTAVPAYNKLKPFHTKGSKWLGYLVKMDGTAYYVSGDTDVNDDIKKVRCDVALIPVGGKFTMDKKQAADYACDIKPKAVIPTHYGEIVGTPADGADFKDYVNKKNSEIQVELKL